MDKLFFGKIPQANKPEQLIDGFYEAPKGSAWFGELDLGDYCYIIGNDKIQFWRAKEWKVVDGNDRLYFEIINNDLGLSINQLIAIKSFKWTKTLVVLTSRSSKTAFHTIIPTKDNLDISQLGNTALYNDRSLYRKINIVDLNEINDRSEDLQLYSDGNKINLVAANFYDEQVYKSFKDNTRFIGNGSKHKDNTLKKVLDAVTKKNQLSENEISPRAFYDAFFCEYDVKEIVKTISERGFYKYAPGKQAIRWATDLAQGEMAVSYKEFDVDLTEINSLEELNVKVGLAPKAQANTTWNLFLFKSAKIGDVIFANKGKNVLVGIGIITGEYRFDNSRSEFKHVRSVNWIIDKEWNYLADRIPTYQTLFRPDTFSPTLPYKDILSLIALDYPDLVPILKAHGLYDQEKNQIVKTDQVKQMQHSLNQILYGPPGTGKTYHTINRALSIIENKSDNDLALENREALKERYQAYVANGQIVFTTFHQSMSYEDFVEGIKPQTVNEKVVYEVEPGIFKLISDKARGAKGNFEQILEQFKTEVNQGVREKALTIKSKSTDFDIEYRGTNVFYVQPHNSSKENPWYPVNIENIRKVFDTGNYERIYNSTYVREIISYWEKEYQLKKRNGSSEEPFVLIIDEINRGNVSAIFGELITLIEDSKRAGASEALELILPYSKEKFSVPSNLYIIGTMNTADRSVEALDTALRRRFAFEEMMPDPSKITNDGALAASAGILEDVNLAQVLTKINERIVILLDADHQIGHSYLINVNDTQALANAFNNCILPLLKEYFYHDDEKIALVLGAGFVQLKAQTNNIQALFPMMQGLEVHSIDSKQQFELKPITADTIITALQTLLNGG